MNTVWAIFIAFGLFCWCGVGVALLCIRERSAYRLAAMPAIGLCAGTLFTLFLARFDLSGRTIAPITLIFFGIVNAAACWVVRQRPSKAELLSALPVGLLCVIGLGISAWPLLGMGMENYWGFANPDHAFYIPVLEYLDTHSFRVPPAEFLGAFHSLGASQVLSISYDSSVILGISYFFSMLSLLTGAPVALLFGVVTAASAFIVPASVYVLCELGLRLRREFCIVAAALAACSAITAYTLYLHSLGTMTVIAVVPIGTAFAIDYLRTPKAHKLVIPVLMIAGMYYNYFPGFAILMIAVSAAMLAAIITQKQRTRAVLLFGGAIAFVVLAVSSTQALIILRRLIQESLSGRLASSEELLVTFSLVLTERGIPFFWGLSLPFRDAPSLFGNPIVGHYVFLVLGVGLFIVLGMAVFGRISTICIEFTLGVSALLGLIFLYAITGNGYGGFKVVSYMHGLALTGLAACGLALWHRLWSGGNRVLSLAPVALLLAFAGLNIANAIELGRESLGGNKAGMNNAAALRFNDFRQLRTVASYWGQEGIIIALPDSVTQYWLIPFLRSSVAEFFPKLNLNVEDSSPRMIREPLIGKYVLHFTDESQELFGAPSDNAVWRNQKFALNPLREYRDFLTFGTGWYRKESLSGSPLYWQRRFRWLRRRGELLILNPSAAPKQLLITLQVGYGGTSLERHVDLYLNGVKFDEITFCGQAKILTRPFVPSGPWSQIELAVRETVSQLPRTHGLGNRWVPADSRHLNIAVSDIALIDIGHADSVSESAIEFGAAKPMTALVNGVYADGWASKEFVTTLRVPNAVTALEISGMIPGVPDFTFPYVIPVSINDVAVEDIRIEHPGRFDIRVPLENQKIAGAKSARLKFGPLRTFVENSGEPKTVYRTLSILLGRLAFAASPNPESPRIIGASHTTIDR